MARRLGEAELLDFLFLPGFSTKQEVTAVSGRGVGLDVVHSMVHSVRGTVRVASRPGQGMRFILQLPITVSVIRALSGRDRRRALRLPPEPDRPHPDGRPRRCPRPRGQAARPARRPARGAGRGDERARAGPGHRGRPRRRPQPATLCRWSSPATAATASAWWSTASWASTTSASRRWTPGWARCPISAARRCWRTAGPS